VQCGEQKPWRHGEHREKIEEEIIILRKSNTKIL